MADFSIISDVSNQILNLLREHMCPELIQSPEAIKLVSPSDKNADFQLGVYLYDIQELREYKQVDLIRTGNNKAQYPPKPLNLFYVVYINTKSQMVSDSENEQRILGRVIQVLMDNAILSEIEEQNEDESLAVTLLTLSFEDKTKLWSVLNLPYQVGIYFSVSPAMLSSRKVKTFTRVLETNFDVLQKDKN